MICICKAKKKKTFVTHFLFAVFAAVLLIWTAHGLPHNQSRSSESQLLEDMFKSYDKYSRPVMNSSHSVQVEIEMVIPRIGELNTRYETLSVTGWLSIFWKDERLNWNVTEYGGLEYVIVDPRKMWLPDFALVNSASGSVFNRDYFKFYKVTVQSNGSVLWETGGTVTISCSLDLTYFPYDQQICVFSYVNWAYTIQQVNLKAKSTAKQVIYERYTQHSQWVNESVEVIESSYDYSLYSDRFPEVHFGLLLRRKPLFYTVNVIIISLFLAFLVLMSFKLPIESGEKISLGVSLLVTFSVLVLTIENSIPETSQSIPILTVYLVCFMCITTISLFESILVLYLYHHNNTIRPPKWARKFIFYGIGYCLNCCNRCPVCVSICHCGSKDGSFLGSGAEGNFTEVNDGNNGEEPKRYTRQSVWMAGEVTYNTYQTSELERNQNEWRTMARIIDYVSFWIFLIIFFFLIIILLAIIPSLSHPIDLMATKDQWAKI